VPNGIITHYNVRRHAVATGVSTLIRGVVGLALVDTPLTPYTAYTYQVMAFNSAGGSDGLALGGGDDGGSGGGIGGNTGGNGGVGGEVALDRLVTSVQTLVAPPDGMGVATVVDFGPDTVSLSWTAPTAVNGPLPSYTVLVRSLAAGADDDDLQVSAGMAQSLTVANLDQNAAYAIRVRVSNSAGSATGSSVTFSTCGSR
jgi:hypothetical protein